jgi:hypothetical protein
MQKQLREADQMQQVYNAVSYSMQIADDTEEGSPLYDMKSSMFDLIELLKKDNELSSFSLPPPLILLINQILTAKNDKALIDDIKTIRISGIKTINISQEMIDCLASLYKMVHEHEELRELMSKIQSAFMGSVIFNVDRQAYRLKEQQIMLKQHISKYNKEDPNYKTSIQTLESLESQEKIATQKAESARAFCKRNTVAPFGKG